MTKILALNSIRGKSGKDTLIGLLESEGRSVFRVAFADILKKECAGVLAGGVKDFAERLEADMHRSVKDVPRHALSIRSIKDSPYRRWLTAPLNVLMGDELTKPRSLRWHLQQYGTEYKREFLKDPDVWLNAGMKEVEVGLESNPDFVVITDLRLPNEYKKARHMEGVLKCGPSYTWKVDKVKTVRIVRDWFIPGVDDQPYHISDIALMAHPFDGLVVNRLGEPWVMLDQLKDRGVID